MKVLICKLLWDLIQEIAIIVTSILEHNIFSSFFCLPHKRTLSAPTVIGQSLRRRTRLRQAGKSPPQAINSVRPCLTIQHTWRIF